MDTSASHPTWSGRTLTRQSLGTRDLARARKEVVALESADNKRYKHVDDATEAFLDHCKNQGLKHSSIRKYRNVLRKLKKFYEEERIDAVGISPSNNSMHSGPAAP